MIQAKLEVVAAELGHEIRVFLATSQTKHATLTTSNGINLLRKCHSYNSASFLILVSRLNSRFVVFVHFVR